MKLIWLFFGLILLRDASANSIRINFIPNDTPLIVRHCIDFSITGMGENAEWEKTTWVALTQIDKDAKPYETRFKILYSATGLYVLFNGQDEKITSPFTKDYENLFKGDVFEVFFHPDPRHPVYFEYEISPLNKELVLLLTQSNKKFTRWMPWGDQQKKIIKNVNILGGQMISGSSIKGWSAELFFPYELLAPMMNVPPASGTRWNANFCRLDYDSGKITKWSWSPIKVSFHEVEKYFSLRFE